jgi:uncharacterized protein (TIGR03437 family)
MDENPASGRAISHSFSARGWIEQKLRFATAAILLPLSLGASAPQVWFCPLDPLFRPEVNYGGSPQYMSLFNPSAPWTQAASHVNVFKIYPQWIGSATDGDLQIQFADLNRRGIALALEYGVLTASSQCGMGVEGFGGPSLPLLNAALRIQKNGGTLRYVGMDEPIYFSTLYTGTNACQWTVDQMAANAAVNIRALLAQFPNVIIGDIEPFPVSPSNWLPQYQAGIEAFRKALGFPLAFFHADLLWDAPSYLADLVSVRKMLSSEGVPFGIIYNGNASDTSDSQWIQSATQHLLAVELNLGSPDQVIFQSWHAYPKKLLPETDPDSFTSLIDTYFRRRTTLSSSLSGSTLQGALTAADTGEPIGNAPINVTISPTAGSGVPAIYTLAGTLPAGTESVVFGARINLECNCSGTSDFLVSSFTMDAGAAGAITRDFSDQLNGWGVSATGSPAGTAKIEGASLHVVAQPGQSVLLNSPSIPFTSTVPYTFRVSAKVSPKSSGSGYFTLVFLGASTEISRVRIPLAAASLPAGGASTDALGRYSLPLPATGSDPFQVQAAYAGSSDTWPAQNTVTWTSQQSVSIEAIANAASYAASAVSPGEIVVLFGSGFGPSTLTYGVYAGGRLTASIGQTTVQFDGIAAPLIYASNTQIAAIVPYGINTTQTTAAVTGPAGTSLSIIMPAASSVPGLFTADSSGSGQLAALNPDGTLNAGNNPAKPGDPIVLFGTGEGQTSPPGVDGLIMETPATPLVTATVTVGGQTAPIDYFGSAPQEVAGVFQLNFRIPLNAPSGNAVPVMLKIGSVSTSKHTTIAIK